MTIRHESVVPLSREHHYGLLLSLKIRRGLARYNRSGEWIACRASDVVRFFSADLLPHFRAEEEVLFPALKTSPEWTALVNDLLGEHRLLGDLTERLSRVLDDERLNIRAVIDGRSPSLTARADLRAAGYGQLLADFADQLEKHIRKEEGELFPLYERLADDVLKEAVGEKIRELVGEGKEPRSRAILFDPWDLPAPDDRSEPLPEAAPSPE